MRNATTVDIIRMHHIHHACLACFIVAASQLRIKVVSNHVGLFICFASLPRHSGNVKDPIRYGKFAGLLGTHGQRKGLVFAVFKVIDQCDPEQHLSLGLLCNSAENACCIMLTV